VFASPLSDFQRRVDAAGLAGAVTYLHRGQTLTLRARPPAPPGRGEQQDADLRS
jgi:hypothetical protein